MLAKTQMATLLSERHLHKDCIMPQYYDFHVTLKHTIPKIWRRFLLHPDATFSDLHEAIQDSFEWTNAHLWQFSDASGREVIARPSHGPLEPDSEPDAHAPLSSYFEQNPRCVYTYDFGDDWEHVVVCQDVRPELEDVFWRRLTDGGHAGAPEDCGGPLGLAQLLKLLKLDRKPGKKLTEEQRERLQWYTQEQRWPKPFDLDTMKRGFEPQEHLQHEGFFSKPSPIDWDLFDPSLREVNHVLGRVMKELGEYDESIKHAQEMWESMVQMEDLKPREPAIYAASLHYILHMFDGRESSQAHMAKAYGTSVSSISEVYPVLHKLLDPSPILDLLRHIESPMDILKVIVKQMGKYPDKEEDASLKLLEAIFPGNERSAQMMQEREADDIEMLLDQFLYSEAYRRLNSYGYRRQMLDHFLIHTVDMWGLDPFEVNVDQLRAVLMETTPCMHREPGFDPLIQQKELVAFYTFAQQELVADVDDDVMAYIQSPQALELLTRPPFIGAEDELWALESSRRASTPKKKSKAKVKAKRKRARASRKKNKRK